MLILVPSIHLLMYCAVCSYVFTDCRTGSSLSHNNIAFWDTTVSFVIAVVRAINSLCYVGESATVIDCNHYKEASTTHT